MRKVKAGFVCFGEVNTPKDIINKKCKTAIEELKSIDFDLVLTPPVSDDPEAKDVKRALKDLSKERFDLLILCIAGWIPSHAVISIAQEYSHIPMLLWGLCGYYKDGTLITTADQAGTSALRKVLKDLNYRFKFVYNCIGKPSPLDEIKRFGEICRTLNYLKYARIGSMGHRDMNLYATLYNPISLKSKIGTEVEFFDILEIVQRSEKISEDRINDVLKKIKSKWQFIKKPEDELLIKGIRYFLALKDKIEERKYNAITLIDVDGMKKLLNFPPAMILTLISDELRIMTTPENDIPGSITQLVVHSLTGQIAPYFEFYEFMEDRLLMGVPDYVPSEIVEGQTTFTLTRFGELSGGILNVSKVKTGIVTLSRLSWESDEMVMHILTGEAVEPRKWEEAGWEPPAPQLPGLEVIIDTPVEDFAQKVLGQHYILSYGNHIKELSDFCKLMDIKVI